MILHTQKLGFFVGILGSRRGQMWSVRVFWRHSTPIGFSIGWRGVTLVWKGNYHYFGKEAK